MDDQLGYLIHEHLRKYKDEEEFVGALANTLASVSRRDESVRALRDHFTQVLRNVRQGDVQIIGKDLEEQVVIISMRSLGHLVRLVDGSVSFAEALAAQPGFEPVNLQIEMYQRKRGDQVYFGPNER